MMKALSIPMISRARAFRLYTNEGKRLVDLWLYGGRALLGHNPPGLLRAFKNNAERGLWVPFPHIAESRFVKALSALFEGGRGFIVYNEENAAEIRKQAVPWRPYTEMPSSAFVPVLPFPFPGAPLVLVPEAGNQESAFPPPDAVSPAALAAAARCVYDLIACSGRDKPDFPKVDKALRQNPSWRRQKIYLWYTPDRPDPERYAGLFRRFLDGGFLLPPSSGDPVILPGELSPGEEAKLAELLASV